RFDWDVPPADGIPRVLYVGEISPGRGVRVLVRAMADVVKRTEAQLVLAGPIAPAFEQELKTGIQELKLEGKVLTTGVVDHDEVPALIASATVCVAPSGPDLSATRSGLVKVCTCLAAAAVGTSTRSASRRHTATSRA
ncbi:MAG TPA: glycosyltransferase, partial [Kofleriaceae bacterium]|nr:glycosyltransferase [Kofleriaceae bacterium]